jgi:methyltransferase (TIGR00027 family)
MSSGKTSTTAYCVACSLSKLARLPQWRPYFSDELVYLNDAFMHHARDTLVKQLISLLPTKFYPQIMDFVFIPGMTHHYLFRKKLIEDQLLQAIADGVQQVIILGAGFDTLALRMAKQYPTVRFFEIDLPATQQAKVRVLEKIGYSVPSNRIVIPADLGQTALPEVLLKHSQFKPNVSTIVVLEGVLMYLGEAEVRALFIMLHGLFSGALNIIFGATTAPDNEDNGRVRMVNALLGRGEETTEWYCPSARMPEFMAELGYRLEAWMPYKKLQQSYQHGDEIATLPEEDENYYLVAKIPLGGRDVAILPISQTSFISVKS